MSGSELDVRQAEKARNLATGAQVVFDPHPTFDELRQVGDVHPGGLHTFFGMPRMQGLIDTDSEFTVIGYDTVEAVFRDHETFSSRVHTAAVSLWGENILFMDEPEHRRSRALAQPAFALKTMRSWEERWLAPVLADLLAGFPDSGPIDLYHGYCAQFPVRTIASAFGIRPSEATRYHEWVLQMSGGGTPEQAMRAVRSIADSLRPIIEDRRQSGAVDDVIGLLASSEVVEEENGSRHRLDDRAILGFANLMLTAGAGTTYRTLGFLCRELARDPDLFDRVRGQRDLVAPLIEETLRWSPPVLSFERRSTRDTTLDGVRIPAGSIVYAVVGAANHDPRRWDRPHEFDPFRAAKPHLAFGNGPHFCLGNQLARMELRVAVGELLDRYSSIRLDPEQPFPETSGVRFRQMDGLPVVVS